MAVQGVLNICFMLSSVLFSSCFSAVPGALNPRQRLNKFAQTLNKPEQIHVSFGSEPTSLMIIWSFSKQENSFVEYGDLPNSITRIAAKSVQLQEHSHLAKQFVYHAELKDLYPGKHYVYRIITGPSEIKSDIFFVDIPHNNNNKPHTYMMVADLGLLTKSLPVVVHEALRNKYEAVFHVGDIAYDLGTEGGSRGDLYMNKIQKFASKVPYLTVPGDHEKADDFYHFRHRFSNPGSHWPMREDELWYSINIGLTHFITINTQAVLSNEKFQKEQLDWLVKDLIKANGNRKQFPWIIAMGHKPLYCTKTITEQECDKDQTEIRDVLEEILYTYGVDLYISGHKHCYERSYPLYKNHALQFNTVNPKAPIYVIIGSMGYEYLFHEQKSAPKWLAAANTVKDKELFARLSIVNSTHLVWSAHVAGSDKKVDEMILVQEKHRPFGISKQEEEITTQLQLQSQAYSLSKRLSIYDPSNRTIMLSIGVFSFVFLVFLLVKYSGSKVRLCC